MKQVRERERHCYVMPPTFFLKNHPYAAAVTTIALAALLCTVEQ